MTGATGDGVVTAHLLLPEEDLAEHGLGIRVGVLLGVRRRRIDGERPALGDATQAAFAPDCENSAHASVACGGAARVVARLAATRERTGLAAARERTGLARGAGFAR